LLNILDAPRYTSADVELLDARKLPEDATDTSTSVDESRVGAGATKTQPANPSVELPSPVIALLQVDAREVVLHRLRIRAAVVGSMPT